MTELLYRYNGIGPARAPGDSGQIDNLAGLRSGNHSLEVGIFAALGVAFPLFGSALIAPLFFVLLLLSTDTFS